MTKFMIVLTHEIHGGIKHLGSSELNQYGPFNDREEAHSQLVQRGWKVESVARDMWRLSKSPTCAIYAEVVPLGRRSAFADIHDLPRSRR